MKRTCLIFCVCLLLLATFTVAFVSNQHAAVFTFSKDAFESPVCSNHFTWTAGYNRVFAKFQPHVVKQNGRLLSSANASKSNTLFTCEQNACASSWLSVCEKNTSTNNYLSRFLQDDIDNSTLQTAVAKNFQTTAKGCIVMERNSGRVLYEHNADEHLPMASTTKIVTALTVINNANLDDVVIIPRQACGIEGSSVYLREGEKLTVRQLLYGLMLRSGNDCAMALALHVGGSVENFAQMMNQTARSLGCDDCNFVNPHGLHDDNHYTSARNLAIITCKALQNDDFAQIVSTKSVKIPNDGYDYPRVLSNKNKLLYNFDDADGVKTGYTKKAGRCFVGSATRNGMQVVVVVLNCGPMFEETSQMLNVAFANYKNVCILPKNKLCGVVYKKSKPVYYYCEQSFSYPISQNEKLERKIHLDEDVQQVDILLSGSTIATLPLTAME